MKGDLCTTPTCKNLAMGYAVNARGGRNYCFSCYLPLQRMEEGEKISGFPRRVPIPGMDYVYRYEWKDCSGCTARACEQCPLKNNME